MSRFLLTENAKLAKGKAKGWRTVGLQLAPHTVAGIVSASGKPVGVCPHSTPACRADCLNQSGHGSRHAVKDARTRRTSEFFGDRAGFIDRLHTELYSFEKSCRRSGDRPAARLNVFSDVAWHRVAIGIFAEHPGVAFYDYTKDPDPLALGWMLPNYHRTASWTELDSVRDLEAKLQRTALAVPFFSDYAGATFLGREIANGDDHDLRFLDAKPGKVIGLRHKGKGGSRPTSGAFGVHLDDYADGLALDAFKGNRHDPSQAARVRSYDLGLAYAWEGAAL